SGCGKTTLLKTVAGILEPDRGNVTLNGKDVHAMVPFKREIVYLYQETLLFPHMNVFDNIAFGLKVRKMDEDTIRQKTSRMLEELGLEELTGRMPTEISGGQKQRAALGRALVVNPDVLLLDEPFGNLDVKTRASMQQLFKQVARKFKMVSLFVTHDLKEAILMGERIALMQEGHLQMFDSRESFVQAPDTWVDDEIAFWNSLK
ncbi:MAG: ATP-binding cassette domain-containing protein, partial [Balneolaceae bacterium]|nr:ATP-binding cassette domain-containing protein [Balneolaceae bacterium]